jgi:hypothetical protein
MGESGSPGAEHWFASKEEFGGEYYKLLLEQYRLYVDSSTKVSERRAAAQTFFLTANTLISTVYGLAVRDDGGAGTVPDAGQWLLPTVGLMLALIWFMLIRAYGSLNSGKFKVISELEKRLPMRMFDLEWHLLQRGREAKHLRLTAIERFIPLIFAAFFAAMLVRASGIL